MTLASKVRGSSRQPLASVRINVSRSTPKRALITASSAASLAKRLSAGTSSNQKASTASANPWTSPGCIPRSEERRVGKECVSSVDLGGRRIIKKKKKQYLQHIIKI